MTEEEIRIAADFVRSQAASPTPRTGLILGSGLGFFANEAIEEAVVIPYTDIPGFPRSTVVGHAGQLILGQVGGHSVACFQGRFHYYEGYSLSNVAAPVRLLAELGAANLLLTNAAGGIREGFAPGDFMRITDHINFMGNNPLIGPNADELGPRFPDLSQAWDPELGHQLEEAAEAEEIALQKGIYLAVTGPSFETPAEIRAFRTLGADAVGMSTVPECIVARHAGLKVGGVSCITNLAAGIGSESLTHEEVAETASRVEEPFCRLLSTFLRQLNAS